jgi:small subunit ribosomal protein S7
VVRRETPPDPKYGSRTLAKFINKVMIGGKKSLAERLVYIALDNVERQGHQNPLDVFEAAMRNATPILEVKPRRVGGATYQVPSEVRPLRSSTLAMRWIIDAARGRTGKPMADRLADEILAAAKKEGIAFKKREDTHKMAEANRAFAHYRW